MKTKFMKVVIIVLLALVLITFTAVAFGEPPEGLAGKITIISKDANSVIVSAEQIGGISVRLTLESYCYQDNIYAGMENVHFSGSITTTFNVGSRIYHGKEIVPNQCWVYFTYYFNSTRAIILDQEMILP